MFTERNGRKSGRAFRKKLISLCWVEQMLQKNETLYLSILNDSIFCFNVKKKGKYSKNHLKIGGDQMRRAKQAVVASAVGLAVLATPLAHRI